MKIREVSFCWHCNKKLVSGKYGRKIKTILVDQIGNHHSVHKDCAQKAAVDGVRIVKENIRIFEATAS